MPQWDVYANPALGSRAQLPFLVVLQSDLLEHLPTRLVAPLSRSAIPAGALPKRLAAVFEIAGEQLLLKPHEAGVIPARALGAPVASLRAQAQRIIDALDAVLSGI